MQQRISNASANDLFRSGISVRFEFFDTIPDNANIRTNHGKYVYAIDE